MKYKELRINSSLRNAVLSMRDSWRIALLTSLLICGLMIGAFVIKNNNGIFSEQLVEIIKESISRKKDSGFLSLLIDSFIPNLMYMILCFSFGLCAVGIPAISVLPLIKGFSIGIISSYIYSCYSVKGVCYCLIILFPAQIISSALLIYAGNEGYYMSSELFTAVSKMSNTSENNSFRLYIVRFLILLAFSLIASLFDALLSILFSRFFLLV